MSGGDQVLVRESAENLFSADRVLSEIDLRRPGVSLSRCELAKATVRPGGVVMQQVLGQHLAQVVLIDDQQPVQELAAQGTDDSFAGRVRSRRLRRAGENPDAVRSEYGVEGAGELVPLENRILDCELRDLGCQAARWYSLIRPLRTGFRRTCHVAGPPAAVTRGGWCALSGMRWPMAWKTASKERVKFDPRSRIRNRKSSNRSPGFIARLRACCTAGHRSGGR